MKKTVISACALLSIFFTTSLFAYANDFRSLRPKKSQLTFDYSREELDNLKHLPEPTTTITSEQLSKLSADTSYLLHSKTLDPLDRKTLPAYLANAQKDFAWLSYLTTGKLEGDLGPVTVWTLQLFIPDATLPSIDEKCFDVYSSTIASLVVNQVAERLTKERKQIANYPVKKGEDVWTPTSPGYVGLNYGSAKTWLIPSPKTFVADMPPENSDFWEKECEEVKKEQKNLNPEKVQAVFVWAGLTGLNAGEWEAIFNDYLEEENIPIIQTLYLRAQFISALTDSALSSFHSKYTYFVKRPSQFDQAVYPVVIIPNHPSYPSAHSTVSATAATLLSKYFPQDKEKWWSLAEEAGMSRIWGGIHYPIDHEAGKKLGKEIGEAAAKR